VIDDISNISSNRENEDNGMNGNFAKWTALQADGEFLLLDEVACRPLSQPDRCEFDHLFMSLYNLFDGLLTILFLRGL
jgi:hypothetical protein